MNNYSLVESHNKFLEKTNNLSSSRPGLWPSETSVDYTYDNHRVCHGKCLRAAWYRAMDYPQELISASSMMKMKLGKMAEKMLIDDYKAMGIWEASNVKFFDRELSLSGELDVVLSVENGKRVMWEIKSYYSYFANREICGAKKPPTPGKPKIDQFLQAIVYAYVFRDKIDEFRMLYFERGDGHRVEFEVGLIPEGKELRPYWKQIQGPYWNLYSEEIVPAKFLMGDIKRRWSNLINYIKTKKLPPRDYVKEYDDETVKWMWGQGMIGKTKYQAWQKGKEKLGDWSCNGYCSYYKQCEQDSK